MNYIFVSLLFASIILFAIILKSYITNVGSAKFDTNQGPSIKKKPCPICGTRLEPGEKVTSHEYRGESSSLVHVFGCPHCYGEKGDLSRICPVCRREMEEDNYLMGTMIRGENKIHLKIKGCTSCTGKAG